MRNAMGMVVLGLLLGLIGTDVNLGIARYTFDLPQLADGVVVAMGIFGLGEIVRNLEHERSVIMAKITGLMPSKAGQVGCHSRNGDITTRRPRSGI